MQFREDFAKYRIQIVMKIIFYSWLEDLDELKLFYELLLKKEILTYGYMNNLKKKK